ncbi:DNA primase large subunit eukaryotic/archaeal [Trinorchestia longiramus]|nr:DNA primase large subunit eukaryotic/archaeal [Trinorchestia longiramus]
MEFGSGLSRFRKTTGSSITQKFSSSLQMYPQPPSGSITLSEFDSMAIERLKILRAIERHNLNGPIKGSDEWVAKIYEEFHKNKNFVVSSERISEAKAAEVEEARRRDHVSHFVLRLAYCRTEELRRWFVAQEVDLFRARFLHTANSKPEVMAFIRDNDLYFSPITNEELLEERENLLAGTQKITSSEQMEGRTFYKVPFTDALELVRSRRVFLKMGYAYVPDTELVTLITAFYRTSLSKALAQTCRALPQLEDDERLMMLLQDFDRRYTGSDYSSKNATAAAITPAMLDTLAAKAFPLCMRKLHDTLNSNHHLKHGGRMQYGLFLKAAGLSLEDALHFWRSHFTKNMDVEKFDKQYAYTIRHNYGKEGKRTDYSPYSCIKIISGSVGPGDAHGCPFKLTDAPVLRQRLIAYGISSAAAGEVVELSTKGHYQIACQKYWEAVHNATLDCGVNHPNQYLEESRKFASLAPEARTAATRIKTEMKSKHVLQTSQSKTFSQSPSQSSDSVKKESIDMDFDDDPDIDFDMLDASIDHHNKDSTEKACDS